MRLHFIFLALAVSFLSISLPSKAPPFGEGTRPLVELVSGKAQYRPTIKSCPSPKDLP